MKKGNNQALTDVIILLQMSTYFKLPCLPMNSFQVTLQTKFHNVLRREFIAKLQTKRGKINETEDDGTTVSVQRVSPSSSSYTQVLEPTVFLRSEIRVSLQTRIVTSDTDPMYYVRTLGSQREPIVCISYPFPPFIPLHPGSPLTILPIVFLLLTYSPPGFVSRCQICACKP